MKRFTARLVAALALVLSFGAGAAQSPLFWGIHIDGTTLQNNIFAANSTLSTMQSGASDPGSAGGAYSFWMDTGNSLWKQRNSTNTGWITLGPVLTPHAYLVGGVVPTTQLPVGGTGSAGILQLNNAVNSSSTSTAATANAVKTAYDTAVAAAIPPGAIMAFGMASCPTGWGEADGGTDSRTGQAGLFAAISTTWGPGNGTTTYNRPDFRGEFLRGWDHGRGVDASRAFASYQKGSMHTIDLGATVAVVGGRSNAGSAATALADLGFDRATFSEYTAARETDVSATNGGVAAELSEYASGVMRPRNRAVIFCIKY